MNYNILGIFFLLPRYRIMGITKSASWRFSSIWNFILSRKLVYFDDLNFLSALLGGNWCQKEFFINPFGLVGPGDSLSTSFGTFFFFFQLIRLSWHQRPNEYLEDSSLQFWHIIGTHFWTFSSHSSFSTLAFALSFHILHSFDLRELMFDG